MRAPAKLLLATLLLFTGIAVAAEASSGIPGSHLNTIILLAGGIGAVAGGIAWVDHKIRQALVDHTDAEQKLDNERHAAVLAEIAHIRELLERRP